MSNGIVLITGLNGYIAGVTAKYLLDNGYSVRGTVRRSSSAKPIIEGPLESYAQSGALSIFEVSDITVAGAFDEAVKGVTAIAHLASPAQLDFTDPEPIIKAAVDGTRTVLESALNAGPQLKTVVYLSSIAAIMTQDPAPYTLTEKDWNEWAEPTAAAMGKETPGGVIYTASKAAAEKAFWKFRDEKKPSFTQTTLNPVFVIGPPLIAPKTAAEISVTISAIWDAFRGGKFSAPDSTASLTAGLGHTVDVRDVAAQVEYIIAHPKQTNGERYLSSAAIATAQSNADILRKAFPNAKGRILEGTPRKGYSADYTLFDKENVQDVDGSKAKQLLKVGEYIPHEKSVIETAKSFAHLV